MDSPIAIKGHSRGVRRPTPDAVGCVITKLEQFTRLSPADRDALAQAMARRWEVDAGADIGRQGDEPGPVRVILAGWACRYKQMVNGQRQITAILLPGDLCDAHVHAVARMDHAIGALTPVILAVVGAGQLAEVAARHPRIGAALWWDMMATASIQREWTVNLGRRSGPERLGHLFCELHERLRGLGLTQGGGCDLPLSQSVLAEAAGLTVAHVNRSLQTLRAQGLIVLKGRRLTILDVDRLRRVSLFDPGYLHLGHLGAHLDAEDREPDPGTAHTSPQPACS